MFADMPKAKKKTGAAAGPDSGPGDRQDQLQQQIDELRGLLAERAAQPAPPKVKQVRSFAVQHDPQAPQANPATPGTPGVAPQQLANNTPAGAATHQPQPLSTPALAHQQILGAALQQMVQGPAPQLPGENPMSSFLVLGAILDPKVKAKIWEGKYVELSSLGDSKEPAVAVSVNKDDSLISLTPSKTPPPSNIYQWQRLFSTYAAVYTERFPAQAPGIITYAIRILDLHKQYGGTAWREYDENFRRVRAHCPTLPWHTINWDMAMSSIHLPANQQSQKTPNASQPSSSSHRATQKGTCFKFDQKGSCANTKCRYKHICTICGKGHSRQKCYASESAKPATDASKGAGAQEAP